MMSDTLGRLIGVFEHTFRVTNSADVLVPITIKFDFSMASNLDIKGWLVANRAIAFQRPSRALSASEIRALSGKVIVATDAGKKVKSEVEVERDAVNAMNSMTPDAQKVFIQKLLDARKAKDTENEAVATATKVIDETIK